MNIITNPREIEAMSFSIIDNYLKNINLPRYEKEVVKRVIHASADPWYAKGLIFHPEAVKAGIKAIRRRRNIIVDTEMVKSGIGGKAICLINDKDVIRQSARLKLTRAILSMRKACRLMHGGIVVIGNAPSALFELCSLIREGKARPALIVGLPVGFVGAKESKKRLLDLDIPYITNRSRRGGSAVAAAVVNAILKLSNGG